MDKKIKDFIYDNNLLINTNNWDELFAKAVNKGISIFDLQKLLHKANVEYKLSDHSSGDIISQLDNMNMDELRELATDIDIAIDIGTDFYFEVVEDAKTNEYIEVDMGSNVMYYDKENFINMLYSVILIKIFLYDNSVSYDRLFRHWNISGEGDKLFNDLLDDKFKANLLPRYYSLSRGQINWG